MSKTDRAINNRLAREIMGYEKEEYTQRDEPSIFYWRKGAFSIDTADFNPLHDLAQAMVLLDAMYFKGVLIRSVFRYTPRSASATLHYAGNVMSPDSYKSAVSNALSRAICLAIIKVLSAKGKK